MTHALRSVFISRGIYKRVPGDSGTPAAEVHIAAVYDFQDDLEFEVIVFEIDAATLPTGIEPFLDEGLAQQISVALQGRRVKVVARDGLWIIISKRPETVIAIEGLPKYIELTSDALPINPYSFPLGVNAQGQCETATLKEVTHILVGGESQSGKSTWLNAALICWLLRNPPETLRVAIIDPKEVEFNHYRGDPHIMQVKGQDAIATDVDDATSILLAVHHEVRQRATAFSVVLARTLDEYNTRVAEEDRLPRIVLIIDEVTDIALAAGLNSEFYTLLIRIVSKGAAFGIHVILATQNPKAEVLNTLIRGNMSTRIAFRVATPEHSKTILGERGAERLPREEKGRMMIRFKGPPRVLQGYIVHPEAFGFYGTYGKPLQPQVLSTLDIEIIEFVQAELQGKFVIRRVAEKFKGRLSQVRAQRLSATWEALGWLRAGKSDRDSKVLTEELLDVYDRQRNNGTDHDRRQRAVVPIAPVAVKRSTVTDHTASSGDKPVPGKYRDARRPS